MEQGYAGIEKGQLSACKAHLKQLTRGIAGDIESWLNLVVESDDDCTCKEPLLKIIDSLRTNLPTNFNEYVGHMAFTAAIALFKHESIITAKTSLFSRFLGKDVDNWAADSSKVSSRLQYYASDALNTFY